MFGAEPPAEQAHYGLRRTFEFRRWVIGGVGHRDHVGDFKRASQHRQSDFLFELVRLRREPQQEGQRSAEELDEEFGRLRVHGRERIDSDAHVPSMVGNFIEPHAQRDQQRDRLGKEAQVDHQASAAPR
ncbi:hypothetical protein [Pedococcus bigeumensis]|uniref:hypothetical protein n=1 Tax=Pedococcus bigeumensis TaxID=433644 RepID=UPI002FED597B